MAPGYEGSELCLLSKFIELGGGFMSNDLLAFSILEALPLSSQNILGKNDCLINFFSCSVQECS